MMTVCFLWWCCTSIYLCWLESEQGVSVFTVLSTELNKTPTNVTSRPSQGCQPFFFICWCLCCTSSVTFNRCEITLIMHCVQHSNWKAKYWARNSETSEWAKKGKRITQQPNVVFRWSDELLCAPAATYCRGYCSCTVSKVLLWTE